MADVIAVEVAYAEADRQFLRRLELPAGSTVADAINASGIIEEWHLDASVLETGIWSKRTSGDVRLDNGDRVELYRALKIDPKDARRARAAKTGR